MFSISCLSYSQDMPSIIKELTDIHETNVKLRMSVMPIVKEHGFESQQMDSLDRLIIEFDSLALLKVTAIIEQHGWLGISQIGEIPNETIFLVIQHAQDKRIREKYFPLLKDSAEKGESSMASMATLQDRILIENGKEQIYGTQSKMVNNELILLPIGNVDSVNFRRRSVGLKDLKR